MKKFIIALILAATALSLFCCRQSENPGAADSEADADLNFTIVRGDESSEAVTQAAVSLRKLIRERTGLKLELKTDWTKRGEEITRYDREIIIGPTNRPESEPFYTTLSEAEQPLDYIFGASGEHFIIATPDASAEEAAEAFAEAFAAYITQIKNNGTEAVFMEVKKEHIFPVKSFDIAGSAAGDYIIVYPVSYTEAQAADIAGFADDIYTACGQRIAFYADGSEPADAAHKIIIGQSCGETYAGYGPLDCRVKTDGGNLYLGGANYYANIKAIYMFLYDFAGIEAGGGAKNGTINVENADYNDTYGGIKLLLGAWCTSGDAFETEEQIKDLAEAGFNHATITLPSDEAKLRDMLKWLAIYGIECMWVDGSVIGNFEAEDYSSTQSYISAPVSWGCYLSDEPNASLFPQLAASYARFTSETGKEPFINLFPMYANAEQLGVSKYTDYVTRYLDTVKPALCSVDIYPLNTSDLYGDYLKNLDIVASAARERGIPLSVYIQSVSFAASKRTPSYADLEWQAYCCLSFGAKGIMYFTYMTPYSAAEDFLPALIDHDGNKTERWYSAQKLNAELNFIADEFSTFTNLGAFSHKITAATPYLKFDNQYNDFTAIEEIDCENPLLIGCFERDDAYAFTAVSMTNLLGKKTSEVRVKTSKAAVLYKNGEKTNLTPDAEGFISFILDVGEGVFCVIDK